MVYLNASQNVQNEPVYHDYDFCPNYVYSYEAALLETMIYNWWDVMGQS